MQFKRLLDETGAEGELGFYAAIVAFEFRGFVTRFGLHHVEIVRVF